MILNLKRKYYAASSKETRNDIPKSYVPYKEQKRRKNETDMMTAAGLGTSGLIGSAYYLGKSKKINRLADNQKSELANYSTYLYNRANDSFLQGQRRAERKLSRDLANAQGKKFLGITYGKKRQQNKLYEDFHKRSNEALQSHRNYVNGLENRLKDNFRVIDKVRNNKKGKAGLVATGIAAGGAALTLAARKYKKKRDKEV